MREVTRKPLQIYLEGRQERVLRALAAREHVSLAELIRRSVDRYLEEVVTPEQDPSLGIIGLGRSGRGDLSVEHDAVVATEAGDQHRR